MTDAGLVILRLREQIPPVTCKLGCTSCCGPVPFSHWEWEQLPAEVKQGLVANEIPMGMGEQPKETPALVIIPTHKKLTGKMTCSAMAPFSWTRIYTNENPKDWDAKCSFRGPWNCMIYQFRPIICRLFGIVQDQRLWCKVANMRFNLLQVEDATRITLEWLNILEPVQALARKGKKR